MRGAVLFATTEENVERWTSELLKRAPTLDLRIWPDIGNPADIQFAIVARPQDGALDRCPNLRAVFSMWAGVDGLFPLVPDERISVVRMVEPGLTNGIVTYVVHHVIGFHISVRLYQRRSWQHPFHKNIKVTSDTRVGILGFGHLGQACAEVLLQLGFVVSGFSQTRKNFPGVVCYAGAAELKEFLGNTDVLVSLLPNTPASSNLLNRETLSCLPSGAALINCGRGESVDDAALLDAIQSGHLCGAVLDVFRTEPLPDDHPFWDEPKITISPHCASKPDPRSGSQVILENMDRILRGESLPPGHLASRETGY